jgi:hypothetical protein
MAPQIARNLRRAFDLRQWAAENPQLRFFKCPVTLPTVGSAQFRHYRVDSEPLMIGISGDADV